MLFRVADVENVRITAVKVRFGGKLKSIWVRMHNHPLVEEFILTLDRCDLYFEAPNGSSLTIKAGDITDFELSAFVRYEFHSREKGWHSSTDKPQPKRTVLPIEIVTLEKCKLVETIKRKFGPL